MRGDMARYFLSLHRAAAPYATLLRPARHARSTYAPPHCDFCHCLLLVTHARASACTTTTPVWVHEPVILRADRAPFCRSASLVSPAERAAFVTRHPVALCRSACPLARRCNARCGERTPCRLLSPAVNGVRGLRVRVLLKAPCCENLNLQEGRTRVRRYCYLPAVPSSPSATCRFCRLLPLRICWRRRGCRHASWAYTFLLHEHSRFLGRRTQNLLFCFRTVLQQRCRGWTWFVDERLKLDALNEHRATCAQHCAAGSSLGRDGVSLLSCGVRHR